MSILFLFLLVPQVLCWKPPGGSCNKIIEMFDSVLEGMSERLEEESHDHHEMPDSLPSGHRIHHDHSDNVDLQDLVTDTEHMMDDLGEW